MKFIKVIKQCYLHKKWKWAKHQIPSNLFICTYICKSSLQRKRLFSTAVSHLCHSSCCKAKFFLSIFSWTNILTKYKVGSSSTFANTASCNCCRKINTSLTGCYVCINIQLQQPTSRCPKYFKTRPCGWQFEIGKVC